jgi:hypothetical protein
MPVANILLLRRCGYKPEMPDVQQMSRASRQAIGTLSLQGGSEFLGIATIRRRVPKPAVSRCSKRGARKRDYSITSAAAACSVSGTVRPSALAVLRLMTSSGELPLQSPRPPRANEVME